VKKVLVAKRGPLDGNAYAITAHTLLGRDANCDIQVIDRGVSRRHACVLAQDDGTVLVRDLASHNGTFVRGERVSESLIVPGDELVLGETRFVFQLLDGDPDVNSELEIKLMSGPAVASTVELELTAAEREEVTAALAVRKALVNSPTMAPPAVLALGPACCESPLAARAREEGWRFCPACGSALSH
jgi:pSer/pThr/pTyr-binding forkhead associated (FHA) protein